MKLAAHQAIVQFVVVLKIDFCSVFPTSVLEWEFHFDYAIS